MQENPETMIRWGLSRNGRVAILLMVLAVAVSRIDSPSPKTLFLPLRTAPGDSDVNKKVLDVFKEKGRDYPVYEMLHFSGQMKHQYPPTVFVLYWPLAFVSEATYSNILDLLSRLLFLAGAFMSIMIFEIAWKRTSPGGRSVWVTKWDKILGRSALFTMIIFFYPFQISLHQLQAQTLITTIFIVLLVFELLEKKDSISGWLGGAMMGIAASLKPQYGLYAVWGFFRKKFSFAVALICVTTIVGVLTLFMFGYENTSTFFFKVLPDLSKRGEAYFPNQSMNGLLNRIYTVGMNAEYSYTEYPAEHPVVAWGTRLTLIALIAIGLFTRKSVKNDGIARALDLSFVGLAFTMAGTIAWEHYYGVLVAILALVLPVMLFHRNRRRWMLPAFVVAYVLTGIRWWQTSAFADQGLITIIQSNMYFGSLLVLALLYGVRKRYGADEMPSA